MRRLGSWSIALATVALLLPLGPPAAADHTDPREPLAPTNGATTSGIARGDGTWQHVANFPGGASNALTGGGTDLEFFTPAGSMDVYGAFGTLGQDDTGSVGQRVIQLTQDGRVAPRWVADHGSGHCSTANPGGTLGLQHDSQVARQGKVRLLTDTTDATGRCHDPDGGGIEIVDVSKIANPKSAPREAHLVRLAGFSHTHTVDSQRPWLIYNSSSDFAGRNWIDVIDIRSCFGSASWTLAKRRAACQPLVYRIPFQPEWTQQRDQTTGQLEPGSAACHDITFSKGRLYCAALNATTIIDVSGLVGKGGAVNGTPFPCPVVDGTRTGAKVTDCSAMEAGRTEQATGWKFLGTFHHPGRDCGPAGTDVRTCNSNNNVRSDDGIAVSHEADPTPDQQFMFVTDERGGGVVPPGSSCTPGIDNPFGNGGVHAFDISDPSNIDYATTPDGLKSVYISDAVVPAGTFCDVHVIEQVPGEQRLVAAYYTQGIKIVDYFVDAQGRLQFEERASFTLPNANTWSAEDFKSVDNPDGTRTYFIAADDIHRGIDVVSWTGQPNPAGAQAPQTGSGTTTMNASLVGLSALVLAAAAAYRRRRLQPAP
ncbi:MAG: LPXTG cell wall anchor domain-containing protein [Carbonactinosporaceae bacterium]